MSFYIRIWQACDVEERADGQRLWGSRRADAEDLGSTGAEDDDLGPEERLAFAVGPVLTRHPVDDRLGRAAAEDGDVGGIHGKCHGMIPFCWWLRLETKLCSRV